jgi:hypothetical protein
MNRFGLGESNAPHPLVDHDYRRPAALTLAYLHWWDKGLRIYSCDTVLRIAAGDKQ